MCNIVHAVYKCHLQMPVEVGAAYWNWGAMTEFRTRDQNPASDHGLFNIITIVSFVHCCLYLSTAEEELTFTYIEAIKLCTFINRLM